MDYVKVPSQEFATGLIRILRNTKVLEGTNLQVVLGGVLVARRRKRMKEVVLRRG